MIDWGSWLNQPILLGGFVILAWAYALASGPLRPGLAPGIPFPRKSAVRFHCGLGILVLALGSPLDGMARTFLCSAQTVQDLLVLYPAAALLLSGLPGWMVDPVLGRLPRPVGRTLLGPVVCGAFFVIIVSGWYVPRPFEAALGNGAVRSLRAIAYLAAALLFWWPLLSPSRIFPPLRYGARLLYLFGIEVALTGVFTYILMADHAMYPTYAHAPRLIAALTPAEDQVLAGVLLSFFSSVVLVGALGLNFFRWARSDAKPLK